MTVAYSGELFQNFVAASLQSRVSTRALPAAPPGAAGGRSWPDILSHLWSETSPHRGIDAQGTTNRGHLR